MNRCSLCGALRPTSKLAPYYPLGSDVRRHACEFAGCREMSRAEMRMGVIVDDMEAA